MPQNNRQSDNRQFDIDVLESRIEQIASTLQEVATSSNKLRDRVYGNGNPGIMTTIVELEGAIQNLKDRLAVRDKILSAVALTVLGLVVTLLFELLTGKISINFQP